MLTGAIVILLAFYAGAVVTSGRSWLCVWRGAASFSALRDVTGINDRGLLRRLFGQTRNGVYNVTFATVLRHRRKAGAILTDLPVHSLFLAALGGAALLDVGPVATAVACGAAAHALVLGVTALSVLAGGYQALPD